MVYFTLWISITFYFMPNCRKTMAVGVWTKPLRWRMQVLAYPFDAQPEGRYADEERANIRMSFGAAGPRRR